MWSGEYDACIEHAKEAQATFEALGDRVGAGTAVSIHAVVLANALGNNEAALELAEPWWEELKDDPGAGIEALLTLSRPVLLARSRLKRDYHDVSQQRLLLAERVGGKELVEVFTHLSVHYGSIGAPTLGNVLLQASADLARREQDLPALSLTLINLVAQGLPVDLHAAMGYAQEAVRASQRSGIPFQERLAFANYAIGCWNIGDWNGLDALGEREVTDPELVDETVLAMLAMRSLARGEPWEPRPIPDQSAVDDGIIRGWWAFVEFAQLQHLGQQEAALARGLASVRYIHGESGLFDDLTHLWGPVALLALDLDAEDAVHDLIALVEESSVPGPVGLLAHMSLLRGLLAARKGRSDESELLLREALDGYSAWGSKVYVAHTRARLGQLLGGDEGRSQLDQAHTTYSELGATRWLAELDPARPQDLVTEAT